jgi:hypothetical protein
MKKIRERISKISKLEPNQEVVNELIIIIGELFSIIELLRDEISRLKNHPKRPKIEPSVLEKPNRVEKSNKNNWTKKAKNDKLDIDNEVKIILEEVPKGSSFKGFREFVVQDLVVKKNVTRYLLAQWQKPDGTYISAKLPKSVGKHHFGPGLRSYIVHQHHANRVPQNCIKSDLQDKSINISEGQINNILQSVAQEFKHEKEQLLNIGLQSKYIQTDDTGARHKGKNGVATVICNDLFSYVKSSASKSRINFLEILCAGNVAYTITQEALNYIKSFKQASKTVFDMEQLLGTCFADNNSWNGFLEKKLYGKTTRRIITEGALLGTLINRSVVTPETILLSDGAGQFNLFSHVLCWIHVERSIKRLTPINEQDRRDRDLMLDEFWTYYQSLKEYKKNPSQKKKQNLSDQFDKIFSFSATEIPLTKVIKKIRDNKTQLLRVLDHPEVPLHNNTSERDIREYVTKRKISGGTRSDAGRDARDTLISLYKTCKKLSISFSQFLDDRINKTGTIEPLSNIISKKINPSASSP